MAVPSIASPRTARLLLLGAAPPHGVGVSQSSPARSLPVYFPGAKTLSLSRPQVTRTGNDLWRSRPAFDTKLAMALVSRQRRSNNQKVQTPSPRADHRVPLGATPGGLRRIRAPPPPSILKRPGRSPNTNCHVAFGEVTVHKVERWIRPGDVHRPSLPPRQALIPASKTAECPPLPDHVQHRPSSPPTSQPVIGAYPLPSHKCHVEHTSRPSSGGVIGIVVVCIGISLLLSYKGHRSLSLLFFCCISFLCVW